MTEKSTGKRSLVTAIGRELAGSPLFKFSGYKGRIRAKTLPEILAAEAVASSFFSSCFTFERSRSEELGVRTGRQKIERKTDPSLGGRKST
jgi:hypothetical protein